MLKATKFITAGLVSFVYVASAHSETDDLLGKVTESKPAAAAEKSTAESAKSKGSKSAAPTQAAQVVDSKPAVMPAKPAPSMDPVVMPTEKIEVTYADNGSSVTIGLKGGYSLQSYELSSSGLNVNTDFDGSFRYGLEARFPLNEKGSSKFILRGHESDTKATGLDGLSPNSIQVKRSEYGAGFLLPTGAYSSWSVLVGYAARIRDAEATSTSVAISDMREHGPWLGLMGDFELSDAWRIETEASVLFASSYVEKSASTGTPESGYSGALMGNLLYRMNSSCQFGFGIMSEYSIRNFNGTGDRGTSGAEESESSIGSQIEVRFSL
jgi:hypothetical protein